MHNADDAAGGGKIKELASWWKNLCSNGPMYGYFPMPSKTWVIVKPEYEERSANCILCVGVWLI